MTPRQPARLRFQLLATGSGELAGRVAQLLSISLIGWGLGVDALGIVGLAWSLTAIATGIVHSGPELAGTGNLAQQRNADDIIAQITTLKLAGTVLAMPLLWGGLVLMGHADDAARAQLAAQWIAMLGASTGLTWVFRALGQAPRQGTLRLLQAALTLGFLGGGLLVWSSPLMLPLAEFLAAIICTVLGYILLARDGLIRWPLALPSAHFIRSALTLGAVTSLSNLTWMLPIVMISHAAHISEISHLTASLRLILGFNGLMQVFFLALFPHVSRIIATSPRRGSTLTLVLALQSFGLCTMGVAVLMPLSSRIIRAFVGPDFTEAAPLFAALLPILIPVALASPVTYAFVATGRPGLSSTPQLAATLALALGMGGLVTTTQAGAWAALALHPALWLQAGISLLLAAGAGLLAWPPDGWRKALDPRQTVLLMRSDER